jgi:tetratricopeptide (TPR) repeat protein
MTREDREAYGLVRERFERGDAGGTLEALQALAGRYPRYADLHYMIGILRERDRDLDGAAESLERALELNPSYAEAALALISVCEQLGRHERSREIGAGLEPAIASDGLDATTRGKLANLHAALGDAYREVGDLREAIEAYRKALDRCPGYHDIRQRLGVALREAGLPSRSIAELQRVLRANADYLDAQVQLGVTYYTLGRAAEARAQWSAVLARDPAREDARMYLRLLRAAAAAEPEKPPEV